MQETKSSQADDDLSCPVLSRKEPTPLFFVRRSPVLERSSQDADHPRHLRPLLPRWEEEACAYTLSSNYSVPHKAGYLRVHGYSIAIYILLDRAE